MYEEEFAEVKSVKFDEYASDNISSVHIDPLTAMVLFVPPTEPPIEDTSSYFSDEESLFDENMKEIDTVEYLRLVVDGLFEEERSDCQRNREEFSGSESTEGAELENVIVAAVNEFMCCNSKAGRNENVEVKGSERTAMSDETDHKWVPPASKIPRPASGAASTRKFKPSAITAQALGLGSGYNPNIPPATLDGPARARYITVGLWTDIQIWMSQMDVETMGGGGADIFPDVEGETTVSGITPQMMRKNKIESEGKKWR